MERHLELRKVSATSLQIVDKQSEKVHYSILASSGYGSRRSVRVHDGDGKVLANFGGDIVDLVDDGAGYRVMRVSRFLRKGFFSRYALHWPAGLPKSSEMGG